MATMYSARHYQNIASILSAHCADRRGNDDSYGEALFNDMAVSFADVFENDNPRFQRDRFLKAASSDTYPFGDSKRSQSEDDPNDGASVCYACEQRLP